MVPDGRMCRWFRRGKVVRHRVLERREGQVKTFGDTSAGTIPPLSTVHQGSDSRWGWRGRRLCLEGMFHKPRAGSTRSHMLKVPHGIVVYFHRLERGIWISGGLRHGR